MLSLCGHGEVKSHIDMINLSGLRIIGQVTIFRRFRIGRDGHLDYPSINIESRSVHCCLKCNCHLI